VTATWPAGLPQYLSADGFSEALADNKLESQTDFGPGKSRRRFTANWRMISGTLRCTDDQVDAFEDFYQDTLGGGVDAFLWRDPISQNLSLMKFRGGAPRTQYRSADEFLIQITLWQKAIYAGLRFDSDEVSFDSTLATFDEATTY
jgi:hypothetical protein